MNLTELTTFLQLGLWVSSGVRALERKLCCDEAMHDMSFSATNIKITVSFRDLITVASVCSIKLCSCKWKDSSPIFPECFSFLRINIIISWSWVCHVVHQYSLTKYFLFKHIFGWKKTIKKKKTQIFLFPYFTVFCSYFFHFLLLLRQIS